MRTTDLSVVTRAIGDYDDNFDVGRWLSDSRNIALSDGGDVNLFEYKSAGTYEGHFFYRSRGKAAVKTAERMLEEIFSFPQVDVIVGLTPTDKTGAIRLTRHLGFKSYGLVDHPRGRCELFVLTRSEYEGTA